MVVEHVYSPAQADERLAKTPTAVSRA
jgi:hypothetical protein